jgi:hypothetical protein
MFHTLQEFLTFTKGTAYVLGALVLLSFIGFWLFLTAREK